MPANFDRIARPYRWMEYVTLGWALERCRFTYLAKLGDRRSALVLGDGDGRFLARLMGSNPVLRAVAVDSSREMLRLLERRCAGERDRLDLRHGDALCSIPERRFDVVVTHFFLDCFEQGEVERLVERVRVGLDPGALWVVSEFRVPDGAMRLPARLLIGSLYAAFGVLTGLKTRALPDYAGVMEGAGLVRIEVRRYLGGLLAAELWELRG